MGRFKKGLFLGGILGAGLMWLNATTRGKAQREEIFDHAAEVYRRVKQDVMASDALGQIKQNSYVHLVEKYMKLYKEQYHLAEGAATMVGKIVKAQWDTLADEVGKSKKR